ncbi:MAG: ATP-binding protein [Clostridia bacterium]
MRELALNILDIVENSVKAKAKLVTIKVTAFKNVLTILITDDGCGMSEEFVARVTDPFTTTRTTRKVGMGIPLFKMAAEMAGGKFEIKSKIGVGTTVEAEFEIDNIDRAPLGDIAETMTTLLSDEIATEFLLEVDIDGKKFEFDTRELKEALGGVSISEPQVLLLVRDMIKENLTEIGGERL